MSSQRYKWDDETKDDTPSVFQSTSFPASTPHSAWLHDQQRRRQRRARRSSLIWPVLAVVSTSAVVLYSVSHWLRG